MFRGEGSSGAVSVGLRTNRLIGHFPVSGPPGSPDPSTRQGHPQGWLGKGSGRRGDKDAREAVVGVVYFSRTGPKISARGAG